MQENNEPRYTVAGTDIEEVKRKNAESGMSYKEVLEMLAQRGGHNTKQLNDQNESQNN